MHGYQGEAAAHARWAFCRQTAKSTRNHHKVARRDISRPHNRRTGAGPRYSNPEVACSEDGCGSLHMKIGDRPLGLQFGLGTMSAHAAVAGRRHVHSSKAVGAQLLVAGIKLLETCSNGEDVHIFLRGPHRRGTCSRRETVDVAKGVLSRQ